MDKNIQNKKNDLIKTDANSLKFKNLVPVVFATNETYAPALAVAIKSLISNSSKNREYNIYIFYSKIAEDTLKKLAKLGESNAKIIPIDVTEIIKNSKLYSKDYFSSEMFYRLLIPEILPEFEKVIYLDCDIVVKDDVAKLFEIDLSDNLVGAVKNEISFEKMKFYVENVLKMDTEKYFNSGVLLINSKLMRKLKIKNLCFEFIKKYRQLYCPDQDILNLFCFGKVLFLPDIWNFQAGNELFSDEYQKNRLNELKIIHFTSSIKPWNSSCLALQSEFWEIAKKTEFFDELKDCQNSAKGQSNLDENIYEVDKISNIIIQKKHSALSYPFRMIKLFFVRLKNFGFKKTCKLIGRKLKFFFSFLMGKVNKFNQQKIKQKHLENAKNQKSINEK